MVDFGGFGGFDYETIEGEVDGWELAAFDVAGEEVGAFDAIAEGGAGDEVAINAGEFFFSFLFAAEGEEGCADCDGKQEVDFH